MAEYWSSSFFCLFMDQKLGHEGIYYIMASEKFFLRDPAGSSEQARYRHIVCLCNQSRHRIWLILPTPVIQPAEIGNVYQSQVVRCLSVNVLFM